MAQSQEIEQQEDLTGQNPIQETIIQTSEGTDKLTPNSQLQGQQLNLGGLNYIAQPNQDSQQNLEKPQTSSQPYDSFVNLEEQGQQILIQKPQPASPPQNMILRGVKPNFNFQQPGQQTLQPQQIQQHILDPLTPENLQFQQVLSGGQQQILNPENGSTYSDYSDISPASSPGEVSNNSNEGMHQQILQAPTSNQVVNSEQPSTNIQPTLTYNSQLQGQQLNLGGLNYIAQPNQDSQQNLGKPQTSSQPYDSFVNLDRQAQQILVQNPQPASPPQNIIQPNLISQSQTVQQTSQNLNFQQVSQNVNLQLSDMETNYFQEIHLANGQPQYYQAVQQPQHQQHILTTTLPVDASVSWLSGIPVNGSTYSDPSPAPPRVNLQETIIQHLQRMDADIKQQQQGLSMLNKNLENLTQMLLLNISQQHQAVQIGQVEGQSDTLVINTSNLSAAVDDQPSDSGPQKRPPVTESDNKKEVNLSQKPKKFGKCKASERKPYNKTVKPHKESSTDVYQIKPAEDDKKINENFEKGKVTYGNHKAIEQLLQHHNSFNDDDLNRDRGEITGVIFHTFKDEIRLLSKNSYLKDVNYKVIQYNIGNGAFSVVSILQDTVTKKKFVSKQIKQKLFNRKEVDVMLSSKHQNITMCLGIIFQEDSVQLLQAYSGLSIEELIRKKKTQFSEDEVVDNSIQALSALHYLHGSHLRHMDIQPSNVCICMERNKLFLTDFGSTLLPHESLKFNRVEPTYMSPEYLIKYKQGKNSPVCGKSDVYSWALIMRYMLEGEHTWVKLYNIDKQMNPFPSGIVDTVIQTVIKSPDLVKNDIATSDLTPDLRKVMISLLEENPDQRPTAKKGMNLLQGIQAKRKEMKEFMKRPANQVTVNDETRIQLQAKICDNKSKTSLHQATMNIPNHDEAMLCDKPLQALNPVIQAPPGMIIPNLDKLL